MVDTFNYTLQDILGYALYLCMFVYTCIYITYLFIYALIRIDLIRKPNLNYETVYVHMYE